VRHVVGGKNWKSDYNRLDPEAVERPLGKLIGVVFIINIVYCMPYINVLTGIGQLHWQSL
jgi:hypothetical protein